jgi:hypothetical protein
MSDGQNVADVKVKHADLLQPKLRLRSGELTRKNWFVNCFLSQKSLKKETFFFLASTTLASTLFFEVFERFVLQ